MRRKVRNKKVAGRLRRHRSVRRRISGGADNPRLCVFRSLREIYGSLIDDETGQTLLTESTLSLRKSGLIMKGDKKDVSAIAGESLGKKALEKGISSVVFDRAGYKYHGRVKAFSDGARKAGLKF